MVRCSGWGLFPTTELISWLVYVCEGYFMPPARFKRGPGMQLWPVRVLGASGRVALTDEKRVRCRSVRLCQPACTMWHVGLEANCNNKRTSLRSKPTCWRAEQREVTWTAELTHRELTNVEFLDTWDKCPHKVSCHGQLKHPNTLGGNLRNARGWGPGKEGRDYGGPKQRPGTGTHDFHRTLWSKDCFSALVKHNWQIKL